MYHKFHPTPHYPYVIYLLGIEKGNKEALGNGVKSIELWRNEVKKLDMENRKGCFVGARVLGILKQECDKEFSKSEDVEHS